MTPLAVHVGRFSPPHRGHERIISAILTDLPVENCLIVVGSSNHPRSFRHPFPLADRLQMLRMLFPGLNLASIPDHESDSAWLTDLANLVNCWRHGREDPENRDITYHGGCEEDVYFFIKAGYKVKINNRFDGTSIITSATEVRDCLVHGRDISRLVPDRIVGIVREKFEDNWDAFKKT